MLEKVISLFKLLAAEFEPIHAEGIVLHYIETQTEIAPIVVREWMEGKRSPSSGIQKAIANCLANARLEDFPSTSKLPRIPVEAKPTTISERISRKPFTRRQSIVNDNAQELLAIRQRIYNRYLNYKEVE